MNETVGAEIDLEQTKALNSDAMRALLRRKFPAEQYAMLYEVRDAAGFSAQRNADVICIGLWPSRGCAIEGMEIKISRGDWLRELKKPEKAEAFVRFCDRWWVVAAHRDIVKPEELPPTWGLMVPRGNGLGIVRQAPDLKPEPVDRFLLAAMMKRATDTAADSPEVKARIDLRVKDLTADVEDRIRRAAAGAKREYADLQKAVDEFKARSGVEITEYSGARIGDAVKAVLNGDHRSRLEQLGRMKAQARALVQWFDENVADTPATPNHFAQSVVR